MRILYLSGLWFHDFWFLGHLDRSGHEVLSVRAYRTPGLPEADPRMAAFRRVRHLEATGWFREARAAGEIPELGVARRLRRLLAEFRPDVLQAGWLSDCGVLAALTGYRPFLMTPFGSDVLINPYRSVEHRWKARLAMRCADALTTDSLEVAQRITQLSGFPYDRIVRFPWGIDLGRFRPEAPPSDLRARLGWEGRSVLVATRTLEPLYGTGFLIEALPAVRRLHPEAALLVVGGGSRRAYLEALAARLGVGRDVHFAGHVPNEQLQGHLTASDLYVTGTLSDGTSRSLMEALACGLPAVVTDVPAVREWMQDGVQGVIVRRGDAGALARGILRALSDRAAMRRMGRSGLALARERFDERRNLARLEGIYADLLRGEPPPALEAPEPLPHLDLASVREVPYRHPSARARAAEWAVIAALLGEAMAKREPRWPQALRWR